MQQRAQHSDHVLGLVLLRKPKLEYLQLFICHSSSDRKTTKPVNLVVYVK